MTSEITVREHATITADSKTTARVVESMVVRGDISGLSPEERAKFYLQMCESLSLSAASQPFAVLRLNGKEILYPTRGATDQLAAIHKLNREIVDGPMMIDVAGTKMIYAKCRATHPNGRIETAVATVPATDIVNALMKCETKAKRRATLSILGLGMLDETEIETIPAHVSRAHVETPQAPKSDAPYALPSGLESDLRQIELPAEAVTVWLKHRESLSALSYEEKDAAWKATCARVEEVGKLKNAKVWLKRAIAEEDARRLAAPVEDAVIVDAETPSPAVVASAELEAERRYQGGPSAPQAPAAEGRDPLSTPSAKAFVELLTATNSTDGVVAAWLRFGSSFASEGTDVLRACFAEGVSAYVAYGGLGREEFEIDIKRAKENERGTPDTKSRSKSRKGASAPLARTIDVPTPAEWDAQIGTDTDAGHIAGGFHKRSALWRERGELARVRAITVDRLCALLGRDESDASAWLDGCDPARRSERRQAETDRRPAR